MRICAWYIISMETVVVKAGGDVKEDTQKRSWVRGVFGWFAWVWDRFDFWLFIVVGGCDRRWKSD